MIIRPARSDDAASLAELSGQFGYPAAEAETFARLALILASPRDAVLVAEGEGEVAGWMHLVERLSLESGACAKARPSRPARALQRHP